MDALSGLLECDGRPLVIKLLRTPGRKDVEYMHLFSGIVDIDALASAVPPASPSGTAERVSVSDLTQRVSQLEAEVAELKE